MLNVTYSVSYIKTWSRIIGIGVLIINLFIVYYRNCVVRTVVSGIRALYFGSLSQLKCLWVINLI